ncbi:MAG: CDP-glycerol glycerophosphotransferase family protein, partial [Balneolaceae bacterium]
KITTKSKIHAFGQPVLDFTVSEVAKVDELKTRELLKIPKDKTILLYSPSRYLKYNANKSVKEELDYRIVNDPIFEIFESLSQEFDFEVLIRPHPNDTAEKFKDYVDSLANCRIVNNEDVSLYGALAISDLVVAYNSTIMIEAVLSGKLSFPHNYDESEEYHLPELKDKPFIYSKNFEELKRNLKKALKGEFKTPNTRDFYEKGSVTKIIDLINRL